MTNRPARNFNREMIADSKVAAQIARAIIENDKKTDDKDGQTHTLVPYREFQQSHGKYRAKVYEDYYFLCLANTRVCVGWLVCKHALVRRCEIESAVRKLNTKQGTTGLKTHIESHNKSVSLFKGPIVFGEPEKRLVADAAARASVLGHLPFSFAYRKPVIEALARAFIHIGQAVLPGREVDVQALLPSHTAVSDATSRLATLCREKLRKEIPSILIAGGGVTCDGTKVKSNGRKLYDFIIHFFRIGSRKLIGEINMKLVRHVLFLKEVTSSETAADLREMINAALMDRFQTPLSRFAEKFTFVTDCANTMPCIFGASTSLVRCPLSECWMGCTAHLLNTCMKNMINGLERTHAVCKDIDVVKEIVTGFKKAGWMHELADGYHLIQEAETIFGTTYDVLERFVKSGSQVHDILTAKVGQGAPAASQLIVKFSSLTQTTSTNGLRTFNALQAVIKVFLPLREMQIALESTSTPLLHTVLP